MPTWWLSFPSCTAKELYYELDACSPLTCLIWSSIQASIMACETVGWSTGTYKTNHAQPDGMMSNRGLWSIFLLTQCWEGWWSHCCSKSNRDKILPTSWPALWNWTCHKSNKNKLDNVNTPSSVYFLRMLPHGLHPESPHVQDSSIAASSLLIFPSPSTVLVLISRTSYSGPTPWLASKPLSWLAHPWHHKCLGKAALGTQPSTLPPPSTLYSS